MKKEQIENIINWLIENNYLVMDEEVTKEVVNEYLNSSIKVLVKE